MRYFSCASKLTTQVGGRWWIRTTEVIDDRFTVCSLWPLGKPSIFNYQLDWSWWTDLNPRPADYKSAALPTELHQHFRRSCLSQRLVYNTTACDILSIDIFKFFSGYLCRILPSHSASLIPAATQSTMHWTVRDTSY